MPPFGDVGLDAVGYYAPLITAPPARPAAPLLMGASDGGEIGAYHHARRGPLALRLAQRLPEMTPLTVHAHLLMAEPGGLPMTGDMTSVPLRAKDRWTAARMQQGRVLLDTDWNLDLDGPARDARQLATDTIGPAGVPIGSTHSGGLVGGVLTVGAGHMWVDGLLARNPADLAVCRPGRDPAAARPAALGRLPRRVPRGGPGRRGPADLLDPALDGIDTTTRTRVGWRVRVARPQDEACAARPACPRRAAPG